MVQQILSLSDAMVIRDGTAIEFTMETTGGNSRLVVLAAELPLVIQFFAGIASYTENDGFPAQEISPIPVSGLGVAESETPDKTNLIVKVGNVSLAFECPRSELVEMAQNLLLAASAPVAGSQLN
jgi:hypothetical protein